MAPPWWAIRRVLLHGLQIDAIGGEMELGWGGVVAPRAEDRGRAADVGAKCDVAQAVEVVGFWQSQQRSRGAASPERRSA